MAPGGGGRIAVRAATGNFQYSRTPAPNQAKNAALSVAYWTIAKPVKAPSQASFFARFVKRFTQEQAGNAMFKVGKAAPKERLGGVGKILCAGAGPALTCQ